MGTKKRVKAVLLVEDYDLYPRSAIDSVHVNEIVAAVEAGIVMPPIIVDEQSMRIVDGFHRKRAAMKRDGDEAEIDCDMRSYPSKKEMYLDAIRYNRGRGKDLNGSELTGAILKGSEMRISMDALAEVCGVTLERVKSILVDKTVEVRNASGTRVALHRSVQHMSGKIVSSKQAEIIERSPGQPMTLMLRQLNDLIESDLIDWKDAETCVEFSRLDGNLRENKAKYTLTG
jgi:ParB-like chromosome segregation protein Spo0J